MSAFYAASVIVFLTGCKVRIISVDPLMDSQRVDTTPPSISILDPALDISIDQSNLASLIVVSGTCDEAGRQVILSAGDDQSLGQSGGLCDGTAFTATIDPSYLLAGSRRLQASLADIAGNTGVADGPLLNRTASIMLSKSAALYQDNGTAVGSPLVIRRTVSGVASTVTLTTTSVTAVSDTDFTAQSQTVNFGVDDTEVTLDGNDLAILSQPSATGDSYFLAELSNLGPYSEFDVSGSTRARVTLVDSEVPGHFLFAEPFHTVSEQLGGTEISLLIHRFGSTASAASVDVAFVDGTATAASDFTGTPQTIQFAIGEAEQVVTIAVADNTGAASNRSFYARLVNPSTGTSVRAQSIAKIRILDRGSTDSSCNEALAPFGGGSGTTGDPYLICTLAQLIQVGSNLTASFRLTADIEADATLPPLGSLSGNFDGNERIVRGFKYVGAGAGTNNKGLFSAAGAATAGSRFIRALNVLDFSISSVDSYVGAIVGSSGSGTDHSYLFQDNFVSGLISASGSYLGGIAGNLQNGFAANSQITLVRNFTSGLIKSSVSGSAQLGGLVGNLGGNQASPTVSWVSNMTTATVGAPAGTAVGGVLGKIDYATSAVSATFTNSDSRGTVFGADNVGGVIGLANSTLSPSLIGGRRYGFTSGASAVGGGIGRFTAASNLSVTDFRNFGNVVGSGSNIGGLLGQYASSGAGRTVSFTDVENHGSISGVSVLGGITGYMSVVHSNYSITYSDCHNSGALQASIATQARSGGILGYYYPFGAYSGHSLTIEDCTNLGSITGNGYLGGIAGQVRVTNSGGATALEIHRNISNATISDPNTGSAGGISGQIVLSGAAHVANLLDNTSSGVVDAPEGSGVGGLAGSVSVSDGASLTLSSSAVTFTSYSSAVVTGRSGVGGLIGSVDANGATAGTIAISEVYAEGNVSASSGASGGLIGNMTSGTTSSVTVTHTYATGEINSPGGTGAGGLIGAATCNAAGATLSVSKSSGHGSVLTTHYAGGFMGNWTVSNSCSCTATDIYATGATVEALTQMAGGLLGSGTASSSGTVTITRGYTLSSVISPSQAGGIYGRSQAGSTFVESYWLQDGGINGGLAGPGNQTAAWLKDASNYPAGWLFGTTWNAPSPSTYPSLIH